MDFFKKRNVTSRTFLVLKYEAVKELKQEAQSLGMQKYMKLSTLQHTSYLISETRISENNFNAHFPSNISIYMVMLGGTKIINTQFSDPLLCIVSTEINFMLHLPNTTLTFHAITFSNADM
jgi:hypothetical protein